MKECFTCVKTAGGCPNDDIERYDQRYGDGLAEDLGYERVRCRECGYHTGRCCDCLFEGSDVCPERGLYYGDQIL